jgi:poly(A) polymerase
MTDINTGKKAESFGIVSRLRAAGYKAFIVGGAVRDMVMGLEPKDYDIATDASPEEVERLFERVHPVGAKFGVSLIIMGENTYEVAMFRKDGVYEDGRRPAGVDRSDEIGDVKRRDFTINALLYDPADDRIIDHVGGVGDIENRIIRTVGDPFLRFDEDRLRMLRAVRFAARFGFAIESGTMEAIRANARHISSVSPERIGEELAKMFTGQHPDSSLALLDESGLLERVLPEVAAMKAVEQQPEYHPEGDVFEHTRLMLHLFGGGSVVMAFAALLHDVGKPPAFSRTDRVRFTGHDEVGAEMAENILRRLRLNGETVTRVRGLVRNHMKFQNVPGMRKSTLRRFMAQPHFEELLELHRLDRLAGNRDLSTYHFLKERMEHPDEEAGDLTLPPPFLRGGNLIELGIEPGPVFGRILSEALDAQLEGVIASQSEALEWVRERFGSLISKKTTERKST